MNPVDLACLAVLLLSTLFGLARGFTREALGLASWGGAAFGAFLLLPATSPPAHRLIPNDAIAVAAAWGAGFLVLLVVFSLLSDLVARLVRRVRLGGLDRLLGAAFGIVRGAALVAGAYVLGSLVVPPTRWPAEIRSAHALPIAYQGAVWASTLFPPGLRPQILPPGVQGGDARDPVPDRSEASHAA